MLSGAIIGFVGGMAVADVTSALLTTLCAVLFGITFLVLHFVQGKKIYALLCVTFLVAVLGAGRVALVPVVVPETFLPLTDTEVSLEGKIVADPDIRETTQRVTVEVAVDEDITRLLVVAPLFPRVSYGEQVQVRGILERPEPFGTDGGRVFEYDEFLKKDGIFLIVSDASLVPLAPRSGFDHVLGSLADVKRAGLDALSIALPEPQAALAGGLILGGKQGLGSTLLDQFIVAGLVHIVVLSGYNVMVVAEFVLRLAGLVSRRFAPLVAGVTILAFVLVAGAGAASIRAGIMATIAVYARATGRTYDAFRALVFAGILMLLWNPLTLLHDPGFQLSFVATAGLIFGAPFMEARLVFIRSRFFREIFSSTLAAQIAVLPLLLYQNGLFSLVALPANILVLPVVPFAMLASAVALIAGLAAPVVAPVFGLPAYALLSYIIWLTEEAATLPLAAFSIPAFPFALVVLAYVFLYYAIRSSTTDQLRFARKAST